MSTARCASSTRSAATVRFRKLHGWATALSAERYIPGPHNQFALNLGRVWTCMLIGFSRQGAPILRDGRLMQVCRRLRAAPSQIVLSWYRHHRVVAIPKTQSEVCFCSNPWTCAALYGLYLFVVIVCLGAHGRELEKRCAGRRGHCHVGWHRPPSSFFSFGNGCGRRATIALVRAASTTAARNVVSGSKQLQRSPFCRCTDRW